MKGSSGVKGWTWGHVESLAVSRVGSSNYGVDVLPNESLLFFDNYVLYFSHSGVGKVWPWKMNTSLEKF